MNAPDNFVPFEDLTDQDLRSLEEQAEEYARGEMESAASEAAEAAAYRSYNK